MLEALIKDIEQITNRINRIRNINIYVITKLKLKKNKKSEIKCTLQNVLLQLGGQFLFTNNITSLETLIIFFLVNFASQFLFYVIYSAELVHFKILFFNKKRHFIINMLKLYIAIYTLYLYSVLLESTKNLNLTGRLSNALFQSKEQKLT